MKTKESKLSNGIKTMITSLPSYKTISIVLLVGVGSKHETNQINGLAHALEHMNFKTTKKFENIKKILDNIGCHFNAYTVRSLTAYHFKVSSTSKDIETVLDVLSEMVFEGQYLLKDWNAEKKVIYEEIKQTIDDPDSCIDDYLSLLLFPKSTLQLPTLGTIKSLNKITCQQLKDFHHQYYYPGNMVISLAGHIPTNINMLLNKYLGTKHLKCQCPPLNQLVPVEPISSQTPKIKVIKRTDSQHCYINIAFPGYAMTDTQIYVLKLISIHIGGNMSSILFETLRDKNSLVYHVSSDVYSYPEIGYLSIYTSTDTKNVNKVIKLILKACQNIKITDKLLDSLKVNKINSKSIEYEDTYLLAEYYAEHMLLYPKVVSHNDKLKNYNSITLNDINKVIKEVIDMDRMKMVVIGNISEKDISV